MTQRVCHPSSLLYALFSLIGFFFFSFFYPHNQVFTTASKQTEEGICFFFILVLQKSTSQPELSSGGGSSLSSGKLSKLLVSIADVTWWMERSIVIFIISGTLMRVRQTYIGDDGRCQRPFLQTLPVKAFKPSTGAPVTLSKCSLKYLTGQLCD